MGQPGSSGSQSEPTQPLLPNEYTRYVAPPPPYTAPPPYLPSAPAFQHNKFSGLPKELADDIMGAQTELRKVGILPGHHARVILALDISYSMQNPNEFFFNEESGTDAPIITLLRKILAIVMAFDADGEVEIIPFGTTASSFVYKATKHNFATVISEHIIGDDPVKTMQPNTNYAAVMRAVRQLCFNDATTQNTRRQADVPIVLIVATDGDHNMEKEAAIRQVRTSSYEPIFCKFIALQGKKSTEFTFLEDLDNAPTLDHPYHRNDTKQANKYKPQDCAFIDNVDFVPLPDPSKLTPELILREYPQWLMQAQKEHHGHVLLTADQKIDEKIVQAGTAAADRVGEDRPSKCCTIL